MSEYIGILDIGSGYLKGLVSYIDETVYEDLESAPEEYLATVKKPSKGIERGTIIRASAAKGAIKEVLKLLADTGNADLKELYILLTHPRVKFTNLKVELDLREGLSPAEEDGLVQVEETHLQRLKELVRSQAAEPGYEIIHIVPRYFVLDGEKNYEPVGLHASKIEGYYHVIKLKKQVYLNIRNMLRSLNYEVKKVMFPAFVASYDVLGEEDGKKRTLIVDLGHTTTGFSYFTEGSPYITGALDTGLRDIVEAFALSYRIPFKEAQRLFEEIGYYKKQSYSLEGEDGSVEVPSETGGSITIQKAEVGAALRESIAQILVDILNRLSEENVDILNELDEIVLIGGGSNIKNIKELFEELLEGDINCSIRLGKRQNISYYGESEATQEGYLDGDFAAARGAAVLVKTLLAKGRLEPFRAENPFELEKKETLPSFDETDVILPSEVEEKPRKGFFGKIVGFFRNIFSED